MSSELTSTIALVRATNVLLAFRHPVSTGKRIGNCWHNIFSLNTLQHHDFGFVFYYMLLIKNTKHLKRLIILCSNTSLAPIRLSLLWSDPLWPERHLDADKYNKHCTARWLPVLVSIQPLPNTSNFAPHVGHVSRLIQLGSSHILPLSTLHYVLVNMCTICIQPLQFFFERLHHVLVQTVSSAPSTCTYTSNCQTVHRSSLRAWHLD